MRNFLASIACTILFSTVSSAQIGGPIGGPLDGIDHITNLRESVIKEFRQVKLELADFRRALVRQVGQFQPVFQFTQEYDDSIDHAIRVARNVDSTGLEMIEAQIIAQTSRTHLTIAIRENRIARYPDLKAKFSTFHQTGSLAFPLFAHLRQSQPSDGTLQGVYFCRASANSPTSAPAIFQSLSFSLDQAKFDVMSKCSRTQLSCSLEECKQGGQVVP
ncbi:MAG: hypothetical protein NT027_11825 [Proteobacteria bacterium]|nr:hypothetical protein [Pseudomonadota bacterium]